MLDVSVSVSASISAVEGVWGMLFQAFENDIEFRLELLKIIKTIVYFRDIFCMMVMFD